MRTGEGRWELEHDVLTVQICHRFTIYSLQLLFNEDACLTKFNTGGGNVNTLTEEYLKQLRQERRNAEEAIKIVKQLLSGGAQENSHNLKRKDVSNLLDISMDTLRNWEMNGLLTVKRKNNGYRVYTDEDIQRLKIIRSLRCANYSLEAIRRLLQQLSKNPNTDIRVALNTPKQTEDIISVCDRLIISLSDAETNAKFLLEMLQEMKILFS